MQHRAEVLEHRLTAAERGRAGDEAVLVDQTGAGQRLGEGVATEGDDVAAGLVLEAVDFFGEVAAGNSRGRPFGLG